MDSMPATFRHAILFARKLNIKYLWIDSLCILQDSESDWHREASQMASIYENSYLTIAATTSSNDEGGCMPNNFDWEITVESGNKQNVARCRRRIRHHTDFVADGPAAASYCPLLTRGWVYQERLLSPRVLHVGLDELFWECNQAIQCECGRLERLAPLAHGTGQFDPLIKQIAPKLLHQAAILSNDDFRILKRWHDIVEEFCPLGLSRERDHLIALAGLAAQMQSIRRSTYIFGLWSDSFALDLLWHVRSARKRISSIPSWSWASIDGSVEFINTFTRVAPSFQLFKPGSSELTDCERTGQLVLSGFISLATPSLIWYTGNREVLLSEAKDEDFDRRPWRIGYTVDGISAYKTACYMDPDIGTTGELLQLSVWCFRVCQTPQYGYCLLLRCLDIEKKMFSRMGLLWISWEHQDGKSKQPLGKEEATIHIV